MPLIPPESSTDALPASEAVGASQSFRRAIRSRVINLAWPVFAELSLQTITQVVDMAMVGHLGAAAIAAIGLSMQPLWLVMSIFMGLSVGTTALVARLVGANNHEEAGHIAKQSLLVSLFISLIVGVAAFIAAPQIIRLMGAEADALPLGISYMRYLVPGYVFMLPAMVATAALRGAGDTRTPMVINLFVNILNVLANYTLIFGHFGFPAMGVDGAGLATTIARIVGAVALVAVLASGRKVIGIPPGRILQFDPEVLKRIVGVGLPATIERVAMSLGMLFYVRTVASLGTVVYAAHVLATNAESLSYMPGIAISTAAATLVGQGLGAKDPEAAEASGWESCKLGALVMGIMGVVFFLFPEAILGIYTDDPEIISLGVVALRVVAFIQIPEAIGFILSGSLRGAGDTRGVFYVTAIGAWAIRLLLAYIFVIHLHWGLLGAWLAMAADWIFRSAMFLARFKGGTWKEIDI